jgi:hemolysin activation/secretion protein
VWHPRFLCLAALCLLASGVRFAAATELPDVTKPGGAQAGSDFSAPVPPNMQRFLAKPPVPAAEKPATGQKRLEVKKIVLQGAQERPDYDLSLAELTALVEQLRRNKLATPQAMPMEPQQRDKLLKELEQKAKGAKSDADLQHLEDTIRQLRQPAAPKDSLTLQQLQEIAASVAQYYRERGFFLVRAYIPPQTIHDGIVHIRILEGILGNVSVEKNTRYPREQLLRPFQALLDKPVQKDSIEQAMLLLNDYPGLSTFAVFRPGLHPGETDLLISVLEEKPVQTQLHVDNYGSQYTGEYRSRVDIQFNNPFGAIDSLQLSLSKTIDPSNGTYGSLYYERHAFGAKNTLGLGASKNDYRLGDDLEPFGITGVTTLAQLYWRRAFQRSRLFNSYGLLQLSRKSAKLNVTEGEDRADELTVLSAEAGFDWSNPSRRHIASGRLAYSHGFDGLLGAMEATDDPTQTIASRRGGSLMFAGGEFSKLTADYNHWFRLTHNHMMHFSWRSQFSDDLLTSLEQFPIGGPNSVRAYSTSEILRDKGFSTSFEWITRAPGFADWQGFGNKKWGEILDAVLFIDYGKGWLNDPLASDREVISLSGIGAGLRFHLQGFNAKFEFASPLGDEKPGNGRDPQYFFEMNFGF